jgi:uncharacterized membrane protein required for colicin V production
MEKQVPPKEDIITIVKIFDSIEAFESKYWWCRSLIKTVVLEQLNNFLNNLVSWFSAYA